MHSNRGGCFLQGSTQLPGLLKSIQFNKTKPRHAYLRLIINQLNVNCTPFRSTWPGMCLVRPQTRWIAQARSLRASPMATSPALASNRFISHMSISTESQLHLIMMNGMMMIPINPGPGSIHRHHLAGATGLFGSERWWHQSLPTGSQRTTSQVSIHPSIHSLSASHLYKNIHTYKCLQDFSDAPWE